jgi:tRNA(fMet)-specific endonuclease VapC
MSGRRYLLDTNAVVALLRGEGDLAADLEGATWVGISIVTVLEFLSFPGLTAGDRRCFEDFARRVEIVDLTASNATLVERALAIRRESNLKLPDAVVAASAQISDAALVNADREFSRVDGLDLVSGW